jgi:spermidine synthase
METATLEATHWTPTTRIDVLSDTAKDVISRTLTPRAAETKLITQDADAFTIMLNQKRVAEMFETVKRGEILGALSLTYRLNPEPADSLVIGVGGGIDIVTARVHGARQITAVEINPATVALDSGPYRDFLQWPSWPGVNLVRGEGRNYVRGKQDAYDTIVMSAVDTFAALNSGAYVLSENYLYTVEAFEDYFRALKSDGTMAIYRWFFLKPRESLRLAGLYQAAAEKAGIARPAQSIMVIAEDVGWEYRWAVTLIKKKPFTAIEVRNVLSVIATRPEMTAIYVPDVLPADELRRIEETSAVKDPASTFSREKFRQLLSTRAGTSRSVFFQDYPYRIEPVYDDRPFFFEYFKPGRDTGDSQSVLGGLASIHGPIGYYILYALLGICSIVCVVCILLPLWIFQRQGLSTPGAIPLVLYFACLGAGFMLFEVGAMQVVTVYIGDPAISLAAVLAGLLLATGIGAFVVSRYPPARALSVITTGALVIAAAICAWLAFAHYIQPRTMHYGLPARIAIVLLGLLPIGALLGLPFPTAIRAIEQQYPRFIAWAWGVNGVTSVLASIISILIAMRFGFSVVVLMAAAVYLLALVSFRMFDSRRRKTVADRAPAVVRR